MPPSAQPPFPSPAHSDINNATGRVPSSSAAQPDSQETPRLVITNLVLTNFKSYFGRQEVGPFNDSFTAIVGPNGSGKSNVIDALLFVFGFRAKKMRQDKLTNLIHHSDENREVPFARVEIHFASHGVANSELVLAREVRRDGSNFYMLDGARSSYASVTNLLQEKGIDLKHKRFLILQGEVESIALMPPKGQKDGEDGLLEYLEDIIGTTAYKVRVSELEEQQDALRAECREKQNRTQIVKADLADLEASRRAAADGMKAHNSWVQAAATLYAARDRQAKRAIEIAEKDLAAQLEFLEQATAEISAKAAARGDIEKRASSLSAEAADARSKRDEAAQALQRERQQKQKLMTQKQIASEHREELQLRLHEASDKVSAAQDFIAQSRTKCESLKSELSSLEQSSTEKNVQLTAVEEEVSLATRDLRTRLDGLQARADPVRGALEQKRLEARQCTARADQKLQYIKSKTEACQIIEKNAEKAITEGNKCTRLVKKLSQDLEELRTEQGTLSADEKRFQGLRSELEKQLSTLRPEVYSARQARESSQSRNRLESELHKLKLKGFYGRLGALGAINPKYDVAVSTAAPMLNHYVVDTVATSMACIDALNSRRLGRAQFLILEKLTAPSSPNENQGTFPAPRLIDLIELADPLFYKPFALALGNTLVVDTIEQANDIVFKQKSGFRTVTLTGSVVNNSGLMSGGGRPLRGLLAKAVSTVSAEELESLEAQCSELELHLAGATSDAAEAASRLQQLTELIPATQQDFSRAELELADREKRMLELRADRRTLQGEIATLQEELKAAQEADQPTLDKLAEEQHELESRLSELDREIADVHALLLKAGGDRVLAVQSEIQRIDRRISKIKKEYAKLEAEIDKSGYSVQSYNKDVQHYQQQLASADESFSTRFEESEMDTSVFEDLEVRAAELTARTSEIEKELSQLNSELKNGAETVRNLEFEKRSKELSASKIKDNISGYLRTVKDIETKLGGLRLYNLDYARDLMAPVPDIQPPDQPMMALTPNRSQDEAAPGAISSDDQESAMEVDIRPASPRKLANTTEAKIDVEQFDAEETWVPKENTFSELTDFELEGESVTSLEEDANQKQHAARSHTINLEAVKNYRARFRAYLEHKSASDRAVEAYESCKDEVQRTKDLRLREFMLGFSTISGKLKELYKIITMGGNAELELVDSNDPFAEGVLFSVMPPKKSWRNIANLSGGEKTLSSLSLVFALHHYKPTPLYVMDEIDAALDFRNVSIIANYIKDRTKNGQFIVISLRHNMFELASRLVGIYKVDNKTSSVTLKV